MITFAQFLLVAIEGLFYHIDLSSKTMLKKNMVPIHRWLIQIALFFSVSILNNHAFDYRISVPVHIILRSGGSMTTLVVGWIWGKKYSRLQVFSVIILTIGCIMSALSDSKGKVHAHALAKNYGLLIQIEYRENLDLHIWITLWVSLFCLLLKFSPRLWVYILKLPMQNMEIIIERVYFTRYFVPVVCLFFANLISPTSMRSRSFYSFLSASL